MGNKVLLKLKDPLTIESCSIYTVICFDISVSQALFGNLATQTK